MRDGDLDTDIVWHEYGHGLTWRMIGRMDGPLAGAIGEGMSDVLSVIVNDDPVVGEYSASDDAGIRSASYEGYPGTYGDIKGTRSTPTVSSTERSAGTCGRSTRAPDSAGTRSWPTSSTA